MIYAILRPLAQLAFKIYFAQIYLLNPENIPKHGAVIMAVNHPSAFLEASLLASYVKRPLYFLTRGDFFRNRFFAWFLRQTHQIPIFRQRDGFENLRQNHDTFAECYRILKERKVVVIFPESRTVLEKRLRPIQKGAAKLAFGFLDSIQTSQQDKSTPGPPAGNYSLTIIPIGVSYSDPAVFNSAVYLNCGGAIQVDEMYDEYQADKHVAIRKLTKQIEEELHPLMIELIDAEKERRFDEVAEESLNRQQRTFPRVSGNPAAFLLQTRLAAAINAGAASLSAVQNVEQDQLPNDRRSVGRIIENLVIAPIALIGQVLNVIPRLAMRSILNKISDPPFYAPVKIMGGFFAYVFYFLILMIPLKVIFNWPLTILILILLGATMYFALTRPDIFRSFNRNL